MDKAERVAEEIRTELMRAGFDRCNKDLPTLTSAEKTEIVAAILRREYGDVRREALEEAIPSNWCDPLLTGPAAALPAGKHTYTEADIERLLNAIRERVRAAKEET